MKSRKLKSPIVYLLQFGALAIFVVATLFLLKQMDTTTNTAIAGSNLISTPTVPAALATATRLEWSRRQTEAPPIDNVWLITPPAWSRPLPTRAPFTPVTEPPPRTLPPQTINAPLRAGSMSVASVHELSIAGTPQFKSPLVPSALQDDGKTLVGSVQSSSGKTAIVSVDIDTGQLRVLAEATETSGSPQVSGRYVIWSERHKLQIYDLMQSQKREVELDTPYAQFAGTMVVYESADKTASRIKAYDIANQKNFPVTDGPGNQLLPMLSKNWVVFRDSSKTVGAPNDYFYWIALNAINLDTREQVHLGMIGVSRYAMPRSLYAIDMPWVAWGTGQAGDTTLHLYNLQTRETSTIPLPMCKSRQNPDPNSVSNFGLSNGIVIFRCGDFPWQYLGYAIKQKEFFSIPIQQPKTEDDNLLKWMIGGDRIMWMWNAYVNGKRESQIYTARILIR